MMIIEDLIAQLDTLKNKVAAFEQTLQAALPPPLSTTDALAEMHAVIDDLQQKSNVLHHKHQQFQLAVEALHVSFWNWDLQTDRVNWTGEHEYMPDVLSMNLYNTYTRFLECVHPDDQQRLAHTLRQAVNAVNHYSIEFRIIWPDGSIRWLEAHGRPTPDVTGTVVCVNGVMRDITGRKYAELAMQETHTTLERRMDERTTDLSHANAVLRTLHQQARTNHETLVALMNSLNVGLALLNAGNRVQIINKALADLLGAQTSDLLGSDWLALDSPLSYGVSGELVWQTRRDGQPRHGRGTYTDRKGQRHILDIKTLPLKTEHSDDRNGRLMLHVVDVTEQLNLEAMLIQSERQAATGKLSTTFAHEVNSPLQAIQNALYLVQRSDDKRRSRYLQIATDGINRISAILQRLLDLHHLEDRNVEGWVDMQELVTHLLTLLQPTLKEHSITAQTVLAAQVPQFWANEAHMTQVLLNIILNAIEAMEQGGELSIRAQLRTSYTQAGTASNGPPPSEEIIVVDITDTGCGMSEETRARVFDPFFTTKPDGAGIGLAVSRKIVTDYQGSLTIHSRPGSGTTVTLALPVNRTVGTMKMREVV
ncbi:MAG: PAS domain-containing protein [Chloroflexaceae bacterium]|nr:PAS domain-containing protein [Chloroflexaceae bacterium]